MESDRELAFIATLLHANKGEQEAFSSHSFPLTVFKIREKEMAWVNRFLERHRRYPSPYLFKDKFGLALSATGDSIEAAFQPIIDFDQYQQLSDVITRTNELLGKDKPMNEVMEFMRTSVQQMRTYSSNSVSDISWAKSHGAYRRYRALVRNLAENHSVMDSPWPSMNSMIRFVRPGELITLYGRPGSCKTWTAINWAKHLAMRKLRVLFITKEMPTDQIEDRFEALHFKLNWENFRAGKLTTRELFKWKLARKKPLPANLVISGDESIEGVGTDYIVRKVKETHADVVFIDGSYLLEVPWVSKRAEGVERLTALTRFFKRLAKTEKLPVFAITQENRQGEDKRGDSTKTGGLTTLYGADSWAQDSDFVIKTGTKRTEPQYKKIMVEKGRESACGSFYINSIFDPCLDFSETTQPKGDKNKPLQIKTDIKLK